MLLSKVFIFFPQSISLDLCIGPKGGKVEDSVRILEQIKEEMRVRGNIG